MTTLQRVACALTRRWTSFYTRGLPADVAGRRRAEIESDLWESVNDPSAQSVDGVQLLGRLLRSVAYDVRWRLGIAPARQVRAAAVLVATPLLIVASLRVLLVVPDLNTPDVPLRPLETNLGPLAAPPPPPPPPPPAPGR